ncbi:hypothetical protein GNI_003860 [Gregarina niphandrodes]|uniref:Uncharacterized protein n=1 Tax=Gregarina niphandrodes TaxID=110365 RepID=A0A023BDM0_GRENI|nr:hypothetical protein GNI_003860 [Gregarina niphandrodes]EZG88835.1 hypothetical protein GNI_003860 [Gregarina niphandrodes]|eukprot:XP_011128534.1 hypothetical protein GNI_003860 [Gregarina niphandrodes]
MGFLSYVREKIHDIRTGQDAKRSPAVHGAAFSSAEAQQVPAEGALPANRPGDEPTDKEADRTMPEQNGRQKPGDMLPRHVMKASTSSQTQDEGPNRVVSQLSSKPSASEQKGATRSTSTAGPRAQSEAFPRPSLLAYDLTTAQSLALSAVSPKQYRAPVSPWAPTTQPPLLTYELTTARALMIGAADRKQNGTKATQTNMETLNSRIDAAKSGTAPESDAKGPVVRLCLFKTHLSPDHQVTYNQTQAQTLLYGRSEMNKSAPIAEKAATHAVSSTHQVLYNETVARQLMMGDPCGSSCCQKMESRLAVYELTQARILGAAKYQPTDDFAGLTNLAIYNLTEARMLAARVGSLREKRPGKIAVESSAKNRRVQMAPTAQYAQTQAQILRFK